MKLSSKIKPLSYLKVYASEIIRTIIITQNGESKIILQSRPFSGNQGRNVFSLVNLAGNVIRDDFLHP